jgi:uncharacterized protein YndB with AHSA1/START domain
MSRANADDYASREIVTTRVFNAPRELVFRAFSQPEHLSHWWGPKGFTNTFHEFDLRAGGSWRFVMHGPDGADYPNENVFVEIESPARIVFDHVSMPIFRATVTFDEIGSKTKVTFRQLFESRDTFDRIKGIAVPGNEQNLDKLAQELLSMGAGGHEMRLSRVFGASKDLVWEAWTDRRHLVKWWGPRGFTNPRCEIDLRIGGSICIDMQGPDGSVYPMVGQFVEIVPGERLVFTSSPIDANGKPVFDTRNTVTFSAIDFGTRVEVHAVVEKVHDPIALRYLSGQEQGWSESLYRLADRLGEMARV